MEIHGLPKVVNLLDKRGYFLLYHQLSKIHMNELPKCDEQENHREDRSKPPEVTEDELGRQRPITLINSQK
ncbi:hypothetical protein BH18THE2_BH18THE2_06360 [soil metagenome]